MLLFSREHVLTINPIQNYCFAILLVLRLKYFVIQPDVYFRTFFPLWLKERLSHESNQRSLVTYIIHHSLNKETCCIYMSRSICNNIQVTRQAVLIRGSSEIPSSHLCLISSPALQVKSRHTAIKIKLKSYIAPEISRVAGKQNFVSG